MWPFKHIVNRTPYNDIHRTCEVRNIHNVTTTFRKRDFLAFKLQPSNNVIQRCACRNVSCLLGTLHGVRIHYNMQFQHVKKWRRHIADSFWVYKLLLQTTLECTKYDLKKYIQAVLSVSKFIMCFRAPCIEWALYAVGPIQSGPPRSRKAISSPA